MTTRKQRLDHLTSILMARCDTLARCSELSDGILRQYLSQEHLQANALVAQWCQAAGLLTWQDAVGNQWARLPALDPQAPRLIIGSHLDTVPYAGAYDGILGVLLGVALLEYFKDAPSLPFHLDVVGFADEEGTRFGVTLIGSKALAGAFNPAWLQLTDRNGRTMAEAMTDFGLDPALIASAAIPSASVLGYWEAHIEQGPVLEAEHRPLGVVTGIAGAKRAKIKVHGQAGHAGTTPMSMRRDALAGAADLIQFIERIGREGHSDDVATVGDLTVSPGAANVIAGHCELQLDVRSLIDTRRDAMIERIETYAQQLAEQRQLIICVDWYHQAPAVLCDSGIQQTLTLALEAIGQPSMRLPSGAGHDAMAIAAIAPVGMLFIRSPGGISHHPDETVLPTDVTLALEALIEAVHRQAHHSKN